MSGRKRRERSELEEIAEVQSTESGNLGYRARREVSTWGLLLRAYLVNRVLGGKLVTQR